MHDLDPKRNWRGLVVGVCLALAGCQQDMANQPRYDTFERSTFFNDERSARPLVDGTVARGHLRDDTLFYTGRTGEGFAETFPFEVTPKVMGEVLTRGQERYNIYCAVCHGYAGLGNGKIVQRGFVEPPSFLGKARGYPPGVGVEKTPLPEAPVGYIYHVITNGYNAMWPYRLELTPRDRWAVVAYVRTLQNLTDEERKKLDQRGAGGRNE